jgi:DNA-binding XRE family transcriptional regulator
MVSIFTVGYALLPDQARLFTTVFTDRWYASRHECIPHVRQGSVRQGGWRWQDRGGGMAIEAAGQASTLATLVRVERRRRGWTQEQLAERADCKTQTVQHIERGQCRRPRGHTLQGVARALGMPVGTLLVAAVQQG